MNDAQIGPDGLTDEERNYRDEEQKTLDQLLRELASTVLRFLDEPEEEKEAALPGYRTLVKQQRESCLARGLAHPEEVPSLEVMEARHGPEGTLQEPSYDAGEANLAVYQGLLMMELFCGAPSILGSMGLMESPS